MMHHYIKTSPILILILFIISFQSFLFTKFISYAFGFLSIILMLNYAKLNKNLDKSSYGFFLLIPFIFYSLFSSDVDINLYQGLASTVNFIFMISIMGISISYLKRHQLFISFGLIYTRLMLLICIIGFFQLAGFVEFDQARNYVTTGYHLVDSNHKRMTSIMYEPAALSYFLGFAIFAAFYLKKFNYLIVFILSIIASQSLYGIIFLLFFIGHLAFFYKSIVINKYFLIAFFLLFLLFIFLPSLQVFIQVLSDRIVNAKFGDYRMMAPTLALGQSLESFRNILFGSGVGQVAIVLNDFELPEHPNTTHWLISDLVTEIGLLGTTGYLLFFILMAGRNREALFFVISILLIGFGWRSTIVILLSIMILLIRRVMYEV